MNIADNKVGVVYLSWLPYGTGHLKSFLESYRLFHSGYDHDLIIIFNGTSLVSQEVVNEFVGLLDRYGVRYSALYYERGQDVWVYKQAARSMQYDYLLFLNTYSILLADNWLKFYVDSYSNDVGLIGATASMSSYKVAVTRDIFRNFRSPVGLKVKFQQLKYLIKLHLLYGTKFSGFPNPHIRTTGFFIRTDLFNSLKMKPVKDKHGAYFFENGNSSMTRQVKAKGLKCCIVDKHGKLWQENDWHKSATFWAANQENLLISDNQTRKYQSASEMVKKQLVYDAWGRI